MDHLVLAAVEEVALEGPAGCTVQQLWKLLEGNLPPEVLCLSVALKQQVMAQLRARPDIELKPGSGATRNDRQTAEAASAEDSVVDTSTNDMDSGQVLVASPQARDMALGIYDQHVVHPLNDEMRRTLELTGKSRKKGAVQSELARICNVPHKNFFIVVKTLETHSLVVKNNIQIRGDGARVQTSILHLTRFAPDLAPGLKFAKTSAGDKSLYAVTDDEATVAILLKRMREMDPAGNGIVRSEFKRFVLRTMHTGNVRQNHRLWRRLQTKMVKSGALDLSVTEVQGKMRTVITALQPEKVQQDQDDNDAAASAFPIMAERSFAREFFHLVLNAGEEGIFMSDLGRQLQFPTRTFHKPNYLQDFLQRLGLMYTKEQKGKAVVVCVRAPGPLLASYRQTNAPEGMWLQQGWLNAVHDAIEAGPPLLDPSTDLAAPSAPLLVATPAEPPLSPLWTAQTTASPQAPALPMQPSPAMAAVSAPVAERGLSHTQDTSQQSASSEGRENGSAKPAELKRHVRFELTDAQMPEIPEPSSTTADLEDEEEAAPALTEAQKEAVEANVHSLPWVQNMSRLSQDRVVRMMLHLEETGSLFRSDMRRFFRDTDPPQVTGSGPDTKTVDRYLTLMTTSSKLQKLSIPVSLTTSAVVAQDLIVYVKPELHVDDALVSKLVKKSRAVAKTRRSQGVIGYHQALRLKAPKQEQKEVPKPRPVRPSKLDVNIVKHGPDLLLKLYDNGYIRAKMIRIRLLHYWICKLLGLGGYERLAAAESQVRPSEHVFTFKAAMPSSDHYQSTAQLTDGIGSWDSPLALDATQLWDWMPVEVFLQTIGTTQDVPNRLELTASGKRLRDLPEEERSNLMDQRGDTRTSQHMEMLRCLGLIESIVVAPSDGKAAFSVAPTVASRYVALTTGVIEVQQDKKRSTASPASTDGKAEYERSSFDLTTREGLESYWAQLAQMSVDYSKPNHGVAMRAWQRPTWFPSTTVPDITNRRAWNTLHVMTIEQSEKLKQAFASGADEHGYVSWVKCMQIAKDLGLEYEQVNALSNMRKAKLGRLEPVTDRPGGLRGKHIVGRTLADLPSDLVAKHEAAIRVNTAKRFAKQGVEAPNIARLVEEHIMKNRKVRARAERKRRGLPPHRLRRKPSEIPEQDIRSFSDRKERRQRDAATRLDDGELGPGFMPKRPPRVRMRASTPAAASDADGAYVAPQFRGPKGPPHSFTVHEDKAILRAFARWRTHRSPEYFVNFRRFKLPVTLDMAKRRFYKALPRYQQTQKMLEELQELCIDVYQRHHARKLEKWQASQHNPQNSVGSLATEPSAEAALQTEHTKDSEQQQRQQQQQQQKSTEPEKVSKAGRPANVKSADEVVKAKRYLTEDKLAKLMHRSVATPSVAPLLNPSSSSARGAPTSPTALPRHMTSPLSPQSPSGRLTTPGGTVLGTPGAMPPPATPATLTPLLPGQSPAKSPPGGRPRLDPFEPIFAVEDEDDEASLRTIEDIIGLILDVTPRRAVRPSQEPRKRRLFEVDGGEARKRRHLLARADEDDDSALLGGDAAASVLQGRSAARGWKKLLPLPARGPLQLPGAKKPNVVEAHAMELIKSLLFQGLAEGDIVSALSQRFTVPEMTAALAFLQQQGLVNVSGVKRPLLLSKLFAEHIEVMEYPEHLSAEAVAARLQLEQGLKPKDAEPQEPVVFDLSHEAGVSGGMVCEVLSLLAADRLQLGFGTLQLDTGEPALDADHSRASSSVNIPIVITPCPGSTMTRLQPIAPSHATTHQLRDSEVLETGPLSEAQKCEPSNQRQSGANGHLTGKRKTLGVDFSTVGPAISDSVRRPPKQAAPPCYRPGSVDAASMNTVMRHISGAAGLGLTQIQLADKLMHGEETCSDVNNVVQALLDAGRLQWAPAFDEELLVAVDTLSKLKPEYQPSLPEDAQPAQDFHSLAGLQAASSRRKQLDKLDGQQATDSNDAAALDASKGQQSVADGPEGAESAQQMENNQVPHIDSTQFEALPSDMQQQQLGGREKQSGAESLSQILLKPWTDHKGALNEPYWAALTQRVMSVIMRNPGIPENLLISQMQALSPQQAKDLLGLMTRQGLLQTQATYNTATAAIPAVFGSQVNSEVQVVRHYFVALGASFGLLPQLSPVI